MLIDWPYNSAAMEHELSTTIDSIPKGMVHGACGHPSFSAPAPGCASVTYRAISPAYYYHGRRCVNISCLPLLFLWILHFEFLNLLLQVHDGISSWPRAAS